MAIDIGHVLQVFSLQLAVEGKKVNVVNKLEWIFDTDSKKKNE